jgi:succinate-acetate transporter protein
MFNFSATITSKTAIVLILVVTFIIVLDSSIVKFVAYSNQKLPTPAYVGIFVAFSALYVGIVFVVLRFVKINQSKSE